MTRVRAPIAITAGEPAGIGPEIVCSALAQRMAKGSDPAQWCVVGCARTLSSAADRLGLSASWLRVPVLDVPTAEQVTPGQLDVRNAPAVLAMLDAAIDGARVGRFAAVVTAPLHKGVINDAGVPFSGHTEYLAAACGVPRVVMMLAGRVDLPDWPEVLRVALATTHLPLRAVADALSVSLLTETLGIIAQDLQRSLGLAHPRIAVTGLNPHAGEGGHMGREEIDVITPVIAALQTQGMAVSGPHAADTLFQPQHLREVDCVLAMYHDQGLPVLKMATFGRGVNVTLGLPFVRTSVDHGTALDLAGTGRAEHGSLLEALAMAETMAQRRAESERYAG